MASSLFFFPSLLFCSLLALASADDPPTEGDQHPPMDCFPTNCGNVTNITYPFWVVNQQPSHCGYPAFKLACENHMPMLDMSSEKYRVKKIDYENHSVVLVDTKVVNSTCPVQYSNTSFSLTPFSLSPANKQLVFLFDCSDPSGPVGQLNYYKIPCSSYNGKFTYACMGDQLHMPSSCEMAVMPVLDHLGDGVGDYLGLLENGFLVNWTVADCDLCLESKGQCGYNNASQNFMCICLDGAHYKTCDASSPPVTGISNTTDGRHSKRTIAIVVGFAGVVLASVSLALCLYKHKKVRNSILCEKNLSDHQSIEDFLEEHGCLAPKRYTYSQLKKITKSFKEELGQGGYGTVFKGALIDGQIVAVKMLNESRGNGEEFMNEVASIGRTSHVNIVSLLGFCFEGHKRALVYDFMVNGSLEKLLSTDKPKSILEWEKLYQIAIGIARGLEYLHRGCKTRIVHFDIKPHNILLDQDFCPKISDFGLAKLCLMKESIISIAGARGTIGYIAPEVFSRNFGVVSSKSDVYSYGMMVLEMAEGKKNPNRSVKNSSEMYFPHWIYEHLEQNQDLLACGVNAESEETVRKMILVGLWCIQTLPQNRPSMSRVIEMLEGSVTDLQVPPRPYLSSSPFGSLVDASLVQDVCLSDDYSSNTS